LEVAVVETERIVGVGTAGERAASKPSAIRLRRLNAMQIDFHHGVTYVVGRLAGFSHDEAAIVAYCAQYVDDATNEGLIRFDNGFSYNRISSAHKMLDYRNFKALANHRVWIPFHFLPANNGLPAVQLHQPSSVPGAMPSRPNVKTLTAPNLSTVSNASTDALVDRLICRPNSTVAQDMVRECIANRHERYGLHRLGVAMHVYADTWAHQGFAGVNHAVNDARHLTNATGQPTPKLLDRLTSFFIGEALPLGHGAVLGNPDRPFLRWGYTNGRGEKIWRDNPQDFLTAAEHLCQAMQRYRLGDGTATVPGLPPDDRRLIAQMLETVQGKGGERHRQWLTAIAAGKFSFGPAQVGYIAKGKGSWKYAALKTEAAKDRGDEVYAYDPAFLNSDWKLFHDALQAHRFYVLHTLLPSYGLCVA
jgi:hypothetical protein